MQRKTQRPVQFELTPGTREAVHAWIQRTGLRSDDFLFPSRIHGSPHLGTRQYARILGGWVSELGLDPSLTLRLRRSQPRSLLSKPKLKRASSRTRPSSCSRTRSAQMSLTLKGAFWPTILPLFQGTWQVAVSTDAMMVSHRVEGTSACAGLTAAVLDATPQAAPALSGTDINFCGHVWPMTRGQSARTGHQTSRREALPSTVSWH